MSYLIIFLGGGLGSVLRFSISSFVGRKIVGNFPWSTLSVNLIGAFLIGVIIEVLAQKYSSSTNLRYLLVTGFLGGFTTFSAFSLESAFMWIRGDYLLLACYILASVLGTISLVLMAMQITKIILGLS
jgi:CrcB protein